MPSRKLSVAGSPPSLMMVIVMPPSTTTPEPSSQFVNSKTKLSLMDGSSGFSAVICTSTVPETAQFSRAEFVA
jgi:hypothetical protein